VSVADGALDLQVTDVEPNSVAAAPQTAGV
jgi:hypothetical protein